MNIDKEILKNVAEHNRRGEKIWSKKLMTLLGISLTQISNSVCRLVKNGELICIPATEGAPFEYLYVLDEDGKNGPANEQANGLNKELGELEEHLEKAKDICDAIRKDLRRR